MARGLGRRAPAPGRRDHRADDRADPVRGQERAAVRGGPGDAAGLRDRRSRHGAERAPALRRAEPRALRADRAAVWRQALRRAVLRRCGGAGCPAGPARPVGEPAGRRAAKGLLNPSSTDLQISGPVPDVPSPYPFDAVARKPPNNRPRPSCRPSRPSEVADAIKGGRLRHHRHRAGGRAAPAQREPRRRLPGAVGQCRRARRSMWISR